MVDSPLLEEVDYTEKEIIDAEYILNRHSRLLSEGLDEDTAKKILFALGGADGILKFYLENKFLETDKLETIHSILWVSQINADNGTDETVTTGSIELHPKNTFIHQIFEYETAEKIINFLYHRYVAIFVFICILYHSINVAIEYIWASTDNAYFSSLAYHIPIVTIDTISITYFIAIILSINIKAFILSIKTFEYWFKFWYSIQLLISTIVYIVYTKYNNWYLMYRIIGCCQVIVVTVLYSLMDGINISSRMKGGFGIAFALYISVFAIYYTIVETSDFDINFMGSDVSLLDIVASTNRILSIFLWKQAILYIWKKNKATIINMDVDIKWKDSKQEEKEDSSRVSMKRVSALYSLQSDDDELFKDTKINKYSN